MDKKIDEKRRNGPEKKRTVNEPPDMNIADFFNRHSGENHLVVLHDYPDPDAISSAFAHQLISEKYGIYNRIVYRGKVSHQQNVALVRLLGIEPLLFTDALDLKHFDGAIFIDNQGTNSKEIVEVLEKEGIPILAVIDHHEKQERLEPEFTDIRRVGATATIYAEYLENGLVVMDRTNKTHVTIATAMMHGLLTDTQGFIRATQADFRAAAFLSQFRDTDLLIQIMSQTRSRQLMEIIRQALENRMIAESFSIAGIGYLRAEDRDAIPQAADFLLTEENVHTAIVYGIVTGAESDERLIGSLRTAKVTLGPDDFLKDVFGKSAAGQYFGGGKELAGGFEIPIGFLSGDSSDEYTHMKWQVYDRQIKQKILAKIGASQVPVESSAALHVEKRQNRNVENDNRP